MKRAGAGEHGVHPRGAGEQQQPAGGDRRRRRDHLLDERGAGVDHRLTPCAEGRIRAGRHAGIVPVSLRACGRAGRDRGRIAPPPTACGGNPLREAACRWWGAGGCNEAMTSRVVTITNRVEPAGRCASAGYRLARSRVLAASPETHNAELAFGAVDRRPPRRQPHLARTWIPRTEMTQSPDDNSGWITDIAAKRKGLCANTYEKLLNG